MSELEWKEPLNKDERKKLMDELLYSQNKPSSKAQQRPNKPINQKPTKIEFILELIESKQFEGSDKERLIQLILNEIREADSDTKSLREDVKVIKIKLGEILNETKDGLVEGKIKIGPGLDANMSNKKVNQIDLRTHKPKDFADFMQLFNDRDGFKYLTHSFDKSEVFDIKEFLKKSKIIFKKKSNQFKIPTNIYSIIDHFAFKENLGRKNGNGRLIHWRDKEKNIIEQGWSSNEVVQWSIENGVSPYNNENFLPIINAFRDVIRIEATPNEKSHELRKMINNVLKKQDFGNSTDINIQIKKNIKDLDCYCHVPSLRIALETIFQEIAKAINNEGQIDISNNKQVVKISHKAIHSGHYRLNQLVIEHLNSYPNKNLNSILDDWFISTTKGSIGTIRYNLYRMADWSIETKVNEDGDERYLKFNMMSADKKDFYENLSNNEVGGFKHIITFYYRP